MKKVLLVGNANTGKSTVFNFITNSSVRVGNWLGVTVDATKKQTEIDGESFCFYDLPGMCSFNAISEDEKNALSEIKINKDAVIINVCDANNLKRNLYLTCLLLEQKRNVILLINFLKSFKKRGNLNLGKLEQILGVCVLEFNAKNRQKETKKLKEKISNIKNNFSGSYLQGCSTEEQKIEARYKFIDEVLKECYTLKNDSVYGYSKIDKIVLNKYFALPIFILILSAVFYFTFGSFGQFLTEALTKVIDKLILNPLLLLTNKLPVFLSKLISEGVIEGVKIVIVFLPQVLLLLMFLNLLEGSGYISRVAFVLDDFFKKVGLGGKSVFTILLGYGCATTAIITSKSIGEKNARIKTAMLTPLMPCNAKIPVFAFIAGIFFKKYKFLIVLAFYILSLFLLVALSAVINKGSLKSKDEETILEFPSYKLINFKYAVKNVFKASWDFLTRVISVVVVVNIIVWILFNVNFKLQMVESSQSILYNIAKLFSCLFKPLGFGSPEFTSAIFIGALAKELIVSSLILTTGGVLEISASVAISFLIFSAYYIPCVSSAFVLKKEVGVRNTLKSIFLMFTVSYLISFVVYNLLVKNTINIYLLLILLFLFLCVKKIIKSKKCKGCNKPCNKCLK